MHLLALPTGIKIGGFEIRFYALLILLGAIVAYLLSRKITRDEGYDDTILEGTFYIAFPMGIIGARIWYVIAEWGKEFANRPFTTLNFFGNQLTVPSVIAFWEGGLAIQGGAILGILTGVWYVHHKKPNYNLLAIVDCVVPNILLAQVIGRWGNFFNQEVYGAATEPGAWKFLGDWFVNQMTIEGQFRQPLFLIEGIINLVGYFLIMFVIKRYLKKYIRPGYLASCYLIWYGLVRVILEPLRDPAFKMGKDGVMASQIMAYAFIIIGIGLIIGFYFLDKYLKKKRENVPENLENYFRITGQNINE